MHVGALWSHEHIMGVSSWVRRLVGDGGFGGKRKGRVNMHRNEAGYLLV